MGGIFILFIGIQMLIRKQKKTQENDRSLFDNEKDIALYPLAFPLMAGPGALTAAVVFSATDNYMKILINIFSILIISVITYFCFRAIYKVSDKLNNRIVEITTRIMGFIITIVGSGLIVAGLQGSNTY
jgi:multiple antibiotic resistance protein